MGFLNNLTQGAFGNYSEVSLEKLSEEYSVYLMENEEIVIGFSLVRDVVIFTDKRVIDIDKQGTTGIKAKISSVYLDSIIRVSVETAGFGIDDSDITIEYITSPFYRASSGVSTEKRTFEFPKRYNVSSLYRYLQTIACQNHEYINR